MFEALLPAIILGKIRHFKIHYLFFSWTFYPVLLTQCVLIMAEICVFEDNYRFASFYPMLKIAVILSFVFPILAFQLYKPALIGSGSIVVGTLLNKIAIAQNHGKMPVFPSLSYLTGYVKSDSFRAIQGIHTLGNSATHLKILVDYIDIGYSILSPGDLFIHFFTFLMLYYTIKTVNLCYPPKSEQQK